MSVAGRLRTFAQVAEECPALTVRQLQNLRHRDPTFADDVCITLGRRVYVDLDALDAWVERQRGHRSVAMAAERQSRRRATRASRAR